MKIFNEGFVAINMKKVSLKLNRPIHCGFTILDNSKTLMYNFHYNDIRENMVIEQNYYLQIRIPYAMR